MHKNKMIDLDGEISLPCEAGKKKISFGGRQLGLMHAHCFSLNTEAKQHFAKISLPGVKKQIISSVAT